MGEKESDRKIVRERERGEEDRETWKDRASERRRENDRGRRKQTEKE